jgi:hypothetical protein
MRPIGVCNKQKPESSRCRPKQAWLTRSKSLNLQNPYLAVDFKSTVLEHEWKLRSDASSYHLSVKIGGGPICKPYRND